MVEVFFADLSCFQGTKVAGILYIGCSTAATLIGGNRIEEL